MKQGLEATRDGRAPRRDQMGRWEFRETSGAMYTSLTGQEATLVERAVHQRETPWLSTSPPPPPSVQKAERSWHDLERC